MGYEGANLSWFDRHVHSQTGCIGEVIFEPGGTCGPRVQRDYELVFLHSGELRVRIDGHERSLPVGRAGLFLPGHREFFQFSRTCRSHHSWVTVHPSLVPRTLQDALACGPFIAPSSEVLGRLLSTGLAIGSIRSATARQLVDYLALSMFAEYIEHAADFLLQESRDVLVTSAARFLADHFPDDDCLHLMHEAVRVSRKTLIERFRRQLNTTPARYLWRLRTERGVQMLVESGLTIAEIAFKCGFQNPFHFSRRVKEYQGVSPKEVRLRAWNSIAKKPRRLAR